MCLYPRIIKNRRYTGYKVKKTDAPKPTDERQMYVSIGCGNCIECRKQKAREWQVRLHEELKVHKYAYFITLTFSEEELTKLCEEYETEMANEIATKAVRRFLERYRKKYGHSLKHWLITERGHQGTERIHLHGILFPEEELNNEIIANIWKYGMTFTGDYCNNKTINYIIKYVTKIDPMHKDYKAIILASAGLGKNYINEQTRYKHRFNGKDTIEYYTLPNGQHINLPIYYRNKLWTTKERALLWSQTLDKDKTYVRGIEVRNISKDGYNRYMRLLEQQQKENEAMGYGNTSKEWKQKDYKLELKKLNNT